jgi:hypothetical protein
MPTKKTKKTPLKSKKRVKPTKKAVKKTKKGSLRKGRAEDKGLLNQTQYAKHRGISQQRVSKMVKDGIITTNARGLIDPKKADKEIEDSAPRSKSGVKKRLKKKFEDVELKKVKLSHKRAEQFLLDRDEKSKAECYEFMDEQHANLAILLVFVDSMLGDVTTITESNRKAAYYKACILELQYKERQKELINAVEFLKKLYPMLDNQSGAIKNKVLALESRLVAILKCCQPEAEVAAKVGREIRETLDEIKGIRVEGY